MQLLKEHNEGNYDQMSTLKNVMFNEQHEE
jgi:hypothetical protein